MTIYDNVAVKHTDISACVVHHQVHHDPDVRHHGSEDGPIIYDYELLPPRRIYTSNGTSGYVLHLYPCRHVQIES